MVKSYAKINLILKILDRRPDGYHNLFSLFQRINLWDMLHFESQKDGILLESDTSDLPLDQTNLVYQAASLLYNKSNKNNGLRIRIQKNIPIGAGLGGGSSNAATTLLAINRLWKLGYSISDLAKFGSSLGSDVPFFCHQLSAAWVTGRGEEICPCSYIPEIWIVLVFPGFSIQTRDAYLLWDRFHSAHKNELTIKDNNNTISSFETLNSRSFLGYLENDFETVIFNQFPLYQELKKRLFEQKAEKILLSGSGSTLLGLFFNEKKARTAEEILRKEVPQGFIRVVRPI